MQQDNKLKETKFLFDKIKKIYPTFAYPDPEGLEAEIWQEVLDGYSHDDILQALKSYRKEEEYNAPPNPAKFKKYLHHGDLPIKLQPVTVGIAVDTDWFHKDIQNGSCRHIFGVYREASKRGRTKKLIEKIGYESYKALNGYQRYKKAEELGIFCEDLLIEVCREWCGKDYNHESSNVINGMTEKFDFKNITNRLSSHFRTDEARNSKTANNDDLFSLEA